MMQRRNLIALFILIAFASYGQQHMFVFLNKKTDKAELSKEEVDKLMTGHMANMARLAKADKLMAAGPFEGGGGIFIFHSNSKAQVEEWISTDPGVQAKRWDIEILPYQPKKGSVCATKEPYEMVMYNFIRYEVNVSKDTFSDLTDVLKEHDQYLTKLAGSNSDIITEARFGVNEGGILIMKGELNQELINQDPAVKKQTMTAVFKQLYIAKGAFCEK